MPPGPDGTHALLPKQQLFLNKVLDPAGPKFTAYVSGIGGGKTIVGCLAIIALAVQYPGDYIICRQFLPELKITTLKTFLDICPKQLIIEHRVADMIVRIRSVNGKHSNVIFRGLEEPDKHRSLNLSGFYIDEASQVSEEAFMLLQGRLRGNGLRKGFLTSNPAGHDWLYRWFKKKDGFVNEFAASQYFLISGSSLENKFLPEGYVQSLIDSWSDDRIQREIMGSFDAFEGAIYSEFRRDVHVVKPFKIPEEWTKFVGADHGFRNPACWIWCAQDYDGNVYAYREFYQKEWLIEQICKGHAKYQMPGVIALNKNDKLEQICIDPSVRAARGQSGESDWDLYLKNLPKRWPLVCANNDVMPGIDQVKSYFKINEKTKRPRLYIFDTCENLIEEITQYRWDEQSPQMQNKTDVKEQPRKKNDHAVDALRYAIMSRPTVPKEESRKKKLREEYGLAGSLRRELHAIKYPQKKDPWQDY